MQPVSSPQKTAPGAADGPASKGAGSLDNPEVYENVPGHIIPIIEREFDDFDTEAKAYVDGQREEAEFVGFRLKQGVYGQRQDGVQMVRVKIPLGGVTPDQMDAFAEIVDKFAPLRKGHVTTRQNVQIHHVPLLEMAKVIRILGDSNLSSREGCGNTVRNVTGDPLAGVCAGEAFDPTPYGGAFIRYFVRNELTQLLPRKFKVAFTSSDEDRAITLIHDLGFIPRIRDGVKGFEIRTGGGTSIMPRVGYTLVEFSPLTEFLKVSEAVLRIFNRADELRANRARARIKFLVDRVGIDEFRKMVDEELKGDWTAERGFDPEPLKFEDDEELRAPAKPANFGTPNGDLAEFNAWKTTNVVAQRQAGFSAVTAKITRGDLTPEQFRGLGQIMRDHAAGSARTTVHQNIVLRWVRDESVYDVWTELKKLGLGDAGADHVTDVVSCPGTDSCKLGITSSMGLNGALQQRLEEMAITDPLTRKIHVKVSGCPNGCSQHHIANIGFHGASMKFDGRQVPAYLPVIGGNFDDGKLRLAKRLKARIPAKRVPDALERWIRHYEAERNDGEPFNDFVDRTDDSVFEGLIKDLSLAVEFSDDSKETFIDWNRNQLYEVVRGEGECAV